MRKHYDIIIAGCGPTGATLANYFGKYNLNVLIFDQATDIIEYPRAVHIDEEVVRIFQELDLYDQMKKNAIKPFEHYSLISKKSKTLLKIRPAFSVSENIADSNWVLQPEIEKHLRNGFSQYPTIEFLKETCWVDFNQIADDISITLWNKEKTMHLTSKFLIACDGGKSAIRKKLNIGLKDFGFEKEWFVVDATYDGKEKVREGHAHVCDPDQPITYVNGVNNHFRWEFMVTKKDRHLPDELFLEKMMCNLRLTFPVDDLKIIRKKRYTFYSLLSEKWRLKNIFLAGDAAHQMPPFLGQGMCSGIKDAKNLAWKINYACKNSNQAVNDLLDSYFNERAPQVIKILKVSTLLGYFIQYSNTSFAPFRDALLKLLNNLPNTLINKLINKHLYTLPIDNFSKVRHPLIGKHIPQPVIKNVVKQLYFDEVCGMDWVVLHLEASRIAPLILSDHVKNISIVCHTPETPNQIQSDFFEKWMAKYKIDFVIFRPDKLIYNLGKWSEYKNDIQCLILYLSEITKRGCC